MRKLLLCCLAIVGCTDPPAVSKGAPRPREKTPAELSAESAKAWASLAQRQQTQPPPAPKVEDADVGEVYRDFSANPAAAEAKYEGRALGFVAAVTDIDRLDDGRYLVSGFGKMPVSCMMRADMRAQVAKLERGKAAVFAGHATGVTRQVVRFADCVAMPLSEPTASR